MSESKYPPRPMATDGRHTWIEHNFPPTKPKKWRIFVLIIFIVVLIASYLSYNGCIGTRRRHITIGKWETCKTNLSSTSNFGLAKIEKEPGGFLFMLGFFGIMTPLGFVLLRRNRFNWLKKTGRWPKEWEEINK